MKLYIDDILVHEFNEQIGITFKNDNIEDVDTISTSSSTTIKVPITPFTRKIFGHADNLNTERFNNAFHRAYIEDGTIIIDGFACLLNSSIGLLSSYYNVEIIGQGKAWAVYAQEHKLYELVMSMNITKEAIIANWASNASVQMFPVQRSDFMYDGVLRGMGLEDLHPFFKITDVFSAIFTKAGYSIENPISQYIDDWYMSGTVVEQDSSLEDETGFKAGRQLSVQNYGAFDSSTVSLVETANPSIKGLYNNNSCFSMNGLMPTFTNKSDKGIAVKFRCQLKASGMVTYSEAGEFLTPNFVNGFTFNGVSVDFAPKNIPLGIELKTFESTQTQETYIKGISANTWTTIKFRVNPDYSGAESYRMLLMRTSALNSYDSYAIYLSDLGNYLYFSNTIYDDTYLIFQALVGGEWINQYNFNLNAEFNLVSNAEDMETLSCTIEAPSPLFLLPNQSISCGDFSFTTHNTDTNPLILISNETTIEAVFTPLALGIGGVASAENCLMDYTMADFIKAFKHLFNLRFFTDEPNKIVYILPRNSALSGYVDWSDKIDYSKEILIEELGKDIGKNIILGYQDDDTAVQDYNLVNPELGTYKEALLNKYASDDEELYNEIFSASLNVVSPFGSTLLNVDNDGNFSTRLVRYLGVQSLASSGMYPSTTQYPYITFKDNSVSIGFEVLKSYYTPNITAYNSSRRVTVYLNLKAKDIEGFARLSSQKRDFRAMYILEIDGERGVYEIESINDYTPDNSTKCTFIKL